MSTIKAAFRGWVPAVNPDHGSTIPCTLVFQLGHKRTPPDITDCLGKAVILNHVFDSETLNADRLVFTDQASREFVLEITAAINNTSHFETGFVAILGAFLLLGLPSLSFCQFPLIFGEELGITNDFSIGEDHEGLQAKIGVKADAFASRLKTGHPR
jgi:hypothetical protein